MRTDDKEVHVLELYLGSLLEEAKVYGALLGSPQVHEVAHRSDIEGDHHSGLALERVEPSARLGGVTVLWRRRAAVSVSHLVNEHDVHVDEVRVVSSNDVVRDHKPR
jgi:hypothetical protein